MATDHESDRELPRQDGPTSDQQLDAQSQLRNNPLDQADHQTGPDDLADRDTARGQSTGNAERASAATGRNTDPRTLDDAQQAFRETRGDRQPRDVNGRS